MLSDLMGFPIFIGWMMHFMIGVVFANGYVFFMSGWLQKIESKILKGALFGFAVFVFAQIMMALMSAMMGGMPSQQGTMAMIMIGSIIGHIVFGIVVSLLVSKAEVLQPA